MICWTECWRLTPWLSTSSNAARMPVSFSSSIIRMISWRSIRETPQSVVTGTVGDRLVAQRQRTRDLDGRRECGRALARQDVQHHVAAAQSGAERFGAGHLHLRQAVREHGGEDFHHLTVAVLGAAQLLAHTAKRAGQDQPLKGAPLR